MSVTAVVAWIGAVTGIASFGHRIWEGHTTRKDERTRRASETAAKARDHALAVNVDLLRWREQWERVDIMLKSVDFGAAFAIRSYADFERLGAIPASLTAISDRLSELGPASRSLQRLVYLHRLLVNEKRRLSDLANLNFLNPDEALLAKERAHFVARFEAMIATLREATQQIQNLLES